MLENQKFEMIKCKRIALKSYIRNVLQKSVLDQEHIYLVQFKCKNFL